MTDTILTPPDSPISNRARYMPQNHFIVATRGPSPELYVWDLSKHPSMPDPKAPPFAPQGVCFGHDKEGYALAWSPFQEGKLLSGGDDATVLLFDAEQAYKDKKVGTHIKGPKQFRAHTKAVEDVAWHCKDSNMAGSVGDDRLLCIWDVRDSEKPAKLVRDAHKDDINCIAFNPTNEFVLATGSAGRLTEDLDFSLIAHFLQFLQITLLQYGIFGTYPSLSPTCKDTPTKYSNWNGRHLTRVFLARVLRIVVLHFGICRGLGKNKPRKMPRTARQNFCFFTGATLRKYPSSHGTPRLIGRLRVCQKTMYFRYGVQSKKFMPTRMRTKLKSQRPLLTLQTANLSKPTYSQLPV